MPTGAPCCWQKAMRAAAERSEPGAFAQPLGPGGAASVNNQLGEPWYGYAQSKAGPEPVPALPFAWSGSGGFLWPVLSLLQSRHQRKTPLLGPFPGFVRRRAGCVRPRNGPPRSSDVLEVQDGGRAGAICWNGAEIPWWAGPGQRLGLALTPSGRRRSNSSGMICKGRLVRGFRDHTVERAILMARRSPSSQRAAQAAPQ